MSADPDVSAGPRSGAIPLGGVIARATAVPVAPPVVDHQPDDRPANSEPAPSPNRQLAASSNGQPSPSTNGQSSLPLNDQATMAPNGTAYVQVDPPPGCTAAQLRRFIKSRAYVPMHELRRRFELNGEADDVSPVDTQHGLVYLGLPGRESQLIGELVRQGEVGLELCRDPRVPIVVGVYPMRPITRQ
jgi:hypothetical protein